MDLAVDAKLTQRPTAMVDSAWNAALNKRRKPQRRVATALGQSGRELLTVDGILITVVHSERFSGTRVTP